MLSPEVTYQNDLIYNSVTLEGYKYELRRFFQRVSAPAATAINPIVFLNQPAANPWQISVNAIGKILPLQLWCAVQDGTTLNAIEEFFSFYTLQNDIGSVVRNQGFAAQYISAMVKQQNIGLSSGFSTVDYRKLTVEENDFLQVGGGARVAYRFDWRDATNNIPTTIANFPNAMNVSFLFGYLELVGGRIKGGSK